MKLFKSEMKKEEFFTILERLLVAVSRVILRARVLLHKID